MAKSNARVDISDLLREDLGAPIYNVKVQGKELTFEFFNPNFYAETELKDDGTLELYIGRTEEQSWLAVTQPCTIRFPKGTQRVRYMGEPKE